MRKFITCVLVFSVLLSFSACGGKKTVTAENRDLAVIYAKMEETLPEMTQLSQKKMNDLYGVSEQLYQEALVYVSSDGLLADEVWLIRANDEASLNTLKAKAESRMQAKDAESEVYSPEQNSIVRFGRVITDGLYLALLVSPEVDALVKAFG